MAAYAIAGRVVHVTRVLLVMNQFPGFALDAGGRHW